MLSGTRTTVEAVDLDAGTVDSRPLAEHVLVPVTTTAGRYLLMAGGEIEHPLVDLTPFQNSGSIRTMPPSPGVTDAVQILDSRTGAWSQARLSEPRRQIVTAKLGNTTLFVGGYDAAQGTSDVVDLFDLTTGTWQTERLSSPCLGRQVQRASVGASGVALLIDVRPDRNNIGPRIDAQTHLQAYDDTSRRWWSVPLSVTRRDAVLGTVGSVALAIGGRDPLSLEPLDVVDLFDLNTGATWTARLSEPKARPLVATAGSQMVIVDRYGGPIADIFDAATGAWSISLLPEPLGPPPNDLDAQWTTATVRERVIFRGYSIVNQGRFAPTAAFDVHAGTWKIGQSQFGREAVPVPIRDRLLYLPTSFGSAWFFDPASGAQTEARPLVSVTSADLIAVLDDRWVLFRMDNSQTGLGVFDADSGAWTRNELPPELAAGGYGSVVRRPREETQWSGDRPPAPPIEIVDLSTGERRVLTQPEIRRQTAVVQGGGRVLVAGGDLYSALVDVFDMPGPTSVAP